MMRIQNTLAAFVVASFAGLLLDGLVRAETKEWGNLKGQVVWAGPAGFNAPELNVDKDKDHCLAKGALLDPKYTVNAANKGVRWVIVWLVDGSNPTKKLAIHPTLAKVKGTKVVIDQPRCQFEPRVLGIREGQILEVKNSAPIPHNVNVIGGDDNPNLNQIIPPGQSLEIQPWKASRFPVSASCSIHAWMKSWIRVFNHPYFAVTDADGKFEIKNAPAGKFNLVSWSEGTGWVQGGKAGVPVEIKSGDTTDFGKIELKPSAD